MQWKGYVVASSCVVSSYQGEWEKNTSDKSLAQLIKLLILRIFSLLYFFSVSFQGRFN